MCDQGAWAMWTPARIVAPATCSPAMRFVLGLTVTCQAMFCWLSLRRLLFLFFKGNRERKWREELERMEGEQGTDERRREDCGSSWEGLVLIFTAPYLGEPECALGSTLWFFPLV